MTWIRSSAKYFHDLIFFALAGVVKILTRWVLGSVHNVSRWQWSGLSWEMIIKSSFCSRSASDVMCGFSVCLVYWKIGCKTELWPASQGSKRMLKEWLGWFVVQAGEKAKRKVQSELSCWTDRDMVIVYVRVRAVSPWCHLVPVQFVGSEEEKVFGREEGKARGGVVSCTTLMHCGLS